MKPPAPKAGKLGGLAKNPKVLAAAAGGVVLLALMGKKGAASSAVDASGSSPAGQSTPGQGGYYDSTANDVYNSLMGQIQTIADNQNAVSSGASTPTPAPSPTPATPAPKPPVPVVAKPKPKPIIQRKPAPPKRAPQLPTYMVQRGDSLSSIASRYGIKDWHSIYAANAPVIGKDPNKIKPGEKLRLPGIPEKKK